MFGQLKNIDDDGGVLLLYLAGELSAGDRAQVERRLATEPKLAAELAELRAAHAVYGEVMNALDATPLPLPEAAMRQRANRLVRQWATRRLAQPVKIVHRAIIPRWMYPVAAAAVIVVSVMRWGVFRVQEKMDEQRAEDTPTYAINYMMQNQQQTLNDIVAAVDDDGDSVDKSLQADSQALAPLQSGDDLNTFLGMDRNPNNLRASP
jgi:anti-sigma-K factor RskA